ncbi:MAG: acrylyl-CoA reductase AcuI [Thalassobaculales bacterium]
MAAALAGERMFKAILLREKEGTVSAAVEQLSEEALPEGDVTVAVACSTLNYKDGMILKGLGRLVRRYPHVPGVDFAGTVESSGHAACKPGDRVVLTGWRVGEARWGGYAQKARVSGDWLVPLPEGFSLRQAMAVGTAGFTAMQAILALEGRGLAPERGPVLVTGAAGGVGSVAVMLLARLGYEVEAATGRPEQAAYLKWLGAAGIVDRGELAQKVARPLGSERWQAAIDNVGGETLGMLLTRLKSRGTCAAVGVAGGNTLEGSLLPFVLRGVALIGIDSALCPMPERLEIWRRLARDLPLAKLDAATEVVPLAALPALADDILAGRVRGRIVVDVNA